MSLATGAKVSRHNWQLLTIPDTAIAPVTVLVVDEKQPLIQQRGLLVEWRPDHLVDDDKYDDDFEIGNNDSSDVTFNNNDNDSIESNELGLDSVNEFVQDEIVQDMNQWKDITMESIQEVTSEEEEATYTDATYDVDEKQDEAFLDEDDMFIDEYLQGV
jgi:hypothetical protein